MNEVQHNEYKINGLIVFLYRFFRQIFFCRFGIHRTAVADITAEQDCLDCGKHFEKTIWPRA